MFGRLKQNLTKTTSCDHQPLHSSPPQPHPAGSLRSPILLRLGLITQLLPRHVSVCRQRFDQQLRGRYLHTRQEQGWLTQLPSCGKRHVNMFLVQLTSRSRSHPSTHSYKRSNKHGFTKSRTAFICSVQSLNASPVMFSLILSPERFAVCTQSLPHRPMTLLQVKTVTGTCDLKAHFSSCPCSFF